MDEVYMVINQQININSQRQLYTGSYVDNLKISVPNEFDVVLRLRFPELRLVKIIKDEEIKGNVKIDLTDVLAHINNNRTVELYTFLLSCVNEENLLLVNKIQQQFQSLFNRILNKQETIDYNGEKYKLLYKRSGPAHTIDVQNITSEKPTLSIDFVPGFEFEPNQSVSERVPTKNWEAIPRPAKDLYIKNYPSFRTSYTESEREILVAKGNMKIAIRLMKKFCNNNSPMTNLKSFYIKTLCLWIDEETNGAIWAQPIWKVMNEVLKRFEDALHNEEIKFFWERDLNLLSLRREQIRRMYEKVRNARRTSDRPISQKGILRLYLTPKEIEQLPDNALRADSIEYESEKKYLFYMTICLYGVALCYQIYRVITQKPDLSV